MQPKNKPKNIVWLGLIGISVNNTAMFRRKRAFLFERESC